MASQFAACIGGKLDAKAVPQQTIRQRMIEMIVETLCNPSLSWNGKETLKHQINELCDELVREACCKLGDRGESAEQEQNKAESNVSLDVKHSSAYSERSPSQAELESLIDRAAGEHMALKQRAATAERERDEARATNSRVIEVYERKLSDLQSRYDSISHFCEVMRFCSEHDMTSHVIVHVGDDSKLEVAADCSDCFWWGCADAEEITPENFQLFRDTVTECESLDASSKNFASLYADELFAARVRKMRPQGASYELYHPALWPLFNACGPERTCEYGNPHKYPTDPSEWKGFKAQRRQTYEELKAERDRLAASHRELVEAAKATISHPSTIGDFTILEAAISKAEEIQGK